MAILLVDAGGAAVSTVQSLNATGSVAAWGCVLEIGNTPLTANITVTLPQCIGQIGKTIDIKRVDNTSFTVTIVPFAGDTIEVTTPTALNGQFGALTLACVSATKSEQISNISQVSLAEFGEQVLGSAVTVPSTSTNSGNATDILSFTLPSAGVWEVDYDLRATTPNQTATSVTGMVALVTDNSNTAIVNSEIVLARFQSGSTSGSGNNLSASGHGVVRITTNAATTYKIRGFQDGSANGNLAYSVQSDNNGRTKVTWRKVSGFVPVTGTTVDYVNAGRTTTFTLSAAQDMVFNSIQSGNIPLNTTTGVFSLTAGKTYELDATLSAAINSGTPNTGANIIYSWVDAVTNLPLSTNSTTGIGRSVAGTSTAPTFTTGGDSRANIVYTPSVNQNVKVRITAVNLGGATLLQIQTQADGTIERGTSFAAIKQIGSSATTTTTRAQVVANTMTGVASGSPGTAITFGTELVDTTNSFNPATGVFTAPRTAQYRVSLQAFTGTVTASQGSRFGIILSTNGATYGISNPIISQFAWTANPTQTFISGSYIKTLNAGDTLTFRAFLDTATSWSCSANSNFDFITIDEINPTY